MQKKQIAEKSASNPVKRKKQALGRGLGAIIPEIEEAEDRPQDFFYCETDLIRPNRFQPRMQFPEDELEELSQSIKEQGQPESAATTQKLPLLNCVSSNFR